MCRTLCTGCWCRWRAWLCVRDARRTSRSSCCATNSALVVDLPRWGPMLSPRVPNLVPIPGPRMERVTPRQRPRPNYGHPQPKPGQRLGNAHLVAGLCTAGSRRLRAEAVPPPDRCRGAQSPPHGVSATGETAYVGQRPPRARRQAWLMRRAQGEGRRILILTHGQLRQCLSGRPVDRPRWQNRICGHQPKILSSTLQTLMGWLVRPAAPSDHGPGPPALTARTCTS